MISIYTLTSGLHDEKLVDKVSSDFLGSLGIEYSLRGQDFSSYGEDELSLIYVRTGGTENVFKSVYGKVTGQSQPVLLLTSGKSNSLAASMEILSYLRAHGVAGEILHGGPEYIKARIERLLRIVRARRALDGSRLGAIGRPSDWLIASACDYEAVKRKTGISIVDIPMEELLDEIKAVSDSACSGQYSVRSGHDSADGGRHEYTAGLSDMCRMAETATADAGVMASLPGAVAIYRALKNIVGRYSLSGLTLRCFDLLGAVGNTGCLALAQLNSEGIVSSCEGDIPALLSMVIAKALTGKTGFQANPSRINPETGEIVFAHCTVPFDMLDGCRFDTHFESGIGVGVKGSIIAGPVTVFKVSGSLDRFYTSEGDILTNLSERDLCRTQIVVRLGSTSYFLTDPIGNHHIVIPGHVAADLAEFMRFN